MFGTIAELYPQDHISARIAYQLYSEYFKKYAKLEKENKKLRMNIQKLTNKKEIKNV